MANHLTIGILAHVDAGKTTLSEAILYTTGAIRKLGRVDHKDAFLDTDAIEKNRGITVFSKEARFVMRENESAIEFTLLDTPGHADFSTEMERTLQVLDYAILLVSGPDGVQGHTATCWKLLNKYSVPTFIFVNKMDQQGTDPNALMIELKSQLGDGVFEVKNTSSASLGTEAKTDATKVKQASLGTEAKTDAAKVKQASPGTEAKADAAKVKQASPGTEAKTDAAKVKPICSVGPASYEDAAMGSEELMDEYLETGIISEDSIKNAVNSRILFPVCFGSALKMEGIDELLKTIKAYVNPLKYSKVTSDSTQTDGMEAGSTQTDGMEAGSTQIAGEFGARVYKISRDKQGNRQTHLKITRGTLRNKMVVSGEYGYSAGRGTAVQSERWNEKVEQIRLYSGTGFEAVPEAEAGMICTVTGLTQTFAGQGLGTEEGRGQTAPMLEPALTYQMILPEGQDPIVALKKLRQLEEEDPTLHLLWKEDLQEIHVQVMGALELEILQHLIETRFDMTVTFGGSSIIYKETIAAPTIGIGHFEPLRHYAEVHLLMEPLPAGSGIRLATKVSEDRLDRNWQRLILTHLTEKIQPGVLTGSDITDIKISIIAGRAHLKHTEGGDFRQATYRAVRQGLRKAMAEGQAVLLEPMYSFRLEIPSENVGKALADMQRLGGKCGLPEILNPAAVDHLPNSSAGEGAQGAGLNGMNVINNAGLNGMSNSAGLNGMSLIKGTGPVATLADYQQDVAAYTKGRGRFLVSLDGYAPCHNQDEVVAAIGYDPEGDLNNPTASVFCQHGGALYVDWQDVDEMAQVDSGYRITDGGQVVTKGSDGGQVVTKGSDGGQVDTMGTGAGSRAGADRSNSGRAGQEWASGAGQKELDEIFLKTYGKSKRDEAVRRQNFVKARRQTTPAGTPDFPQPNWKTAKGQAKTEPYLIIDGYNVVFAWEELKALAAVNIDSAREAFLDVLGNYQGYKKMNVLVVFDGYKVAGGPGSVVDMGDLKVVYTKEAETADRFIEKTVYEMGRKYDVTVVTSDRMVQMAAMGDGARRLSSREFYNEVMSTSEEIRDRLKSQTKLRNQPFADAFKE